MSDSSKSIDSFCENNQDLELELVNFFEKLKIANKAKTKNSSNSRADNDKKQEMSINPQTSQSVSVAPVPMLDIKNLSIIPNFNGNPNKLHRFISVSESILNHYYDTQNPTNFQNTLLVNGILNKLEGRAEEVVAISGSSDWTDIKNTLLQNFGDQRDENCLNQDLVNLRQKPNESPYQFHEKVIHLLNTICNYIDLHSDPAEQQYKRSFFTKQALKTFLAGLREPLGSTIRAMRPVSLAQAVQFISEEDNIKYLQRSNQQPNFMIKRPNNLQPQNYFNPSYFQNSPPMRPMQHPQLPSTSQFPRGNVNIQKHPNPPTQKFPTNAQVFGKPQNVWKPSNVPQPKPTPMSVSTRNTTPQFRRPFQNYQSNQTNQNNQNNYFRSNPAQKPNVIVEELFNTEFEEQPTDCSPEYFNDEQPNEYYNPDQDEQYENFQDAPEMTEET